MSGRRERLPAEAIFGVSVPGREEGLYLFADLHDADDFAPPFVITAALLHSARN
jgi:hypothetical protein